MAASEPLTTGPIPSVPSGTPTRLSSTIVDLSLSTDQPLLSVPSGKTAIITQFMFRSPTGSMALGAFGIGFDAGVCINVVAATAYTSLTSVMMQIALPKNNAAAGVGVATLGLRTTITQAVSLTVDVIGYLV